jgi:hypothetical protein
MPACIGLQIIFDEGIATHALYSPSPFAEVKAHFKRPEPNNLLIYLYLIPE